MSNANDYVDLEPKVLPVATAIEGFCKKHKISQLTGGSGRGWSRWRLLEICPYAYYLRYIKQIEQEKESEPRDVGSLVHAYLAIDYLRKMGKIKATPEQLYQYVTRSGVDALASEKAWALIRAYYIYWGDDDWARPLAAEYPVEDRETKNTCRYDGIVRVSKRDAPDYIAPGVYIMEHKCLAGDSLVMDYAHPRLWRLDELAASGKLITALGLGTNGRLCPTAATAWPDAVRDVYEVVLTSGRRLRASDNHPFLTARGWVPAAALTSSDWIAIPRATPLRRGQSAVADAEVEFIGLMLGDGCLTRGSFDKTEGPVLVRMRAAAAALQLPYREDASAGRVLSLRFGSKARRLLREWELWGHKAATKFVPSALLALNEAQTGILLGALWNTDGCVDLFNDGDHAKVRIAYVSRSSRLCADVQRLLLQFGISSSVTRSSVAYDGARRDVWTTKVVTRSSKRSFLELVQAGVIPFVRYPVETQLAAIKPGDDHPIPTALIRRLVPDAEITGVLRNQLRCCASVSAFFLEKHGQKRSSQRIAAILAQDVRWDRVKSVIVSGREMLYHVRAPATKNFVANDVITHNTASKLGREQLEGWDLDGEILGELAFWQRNGLDKKFGKLQGVMINLLVKTKRPDFQRIIVSPYAIRTKGHITSLKWAARMEQHYLKHNFWPQFSAGCITRYGFCDYYDHCLARGTD